MLSCNRYINQTNFKNYFLYDMLRAHTFCGCFISLRARYVHAYKRALTFLRPVFIKKCYKNPIPIVQKTWLLKQTLALIWTGAFSKFFLQDWALIWTGN